YCALFVAPTEATMGLIQRIFYFHVPLGSTAFVAFFISFISSIAYLRSRAPRWHRLAVSSPEVGAPCVTVPPGAGPGSACRGWRPRSAHAGCAAAVLGAHPGAAGAFAAAALSPGGAALGSRAPALWRRKSPTG